MARSLRTGSTSHPPGSDYGSVCGFIFSLRSGGETQAFASMSSMRSDIGIAHAPNGLGVVRSPQDHARVLNLCHMPGDMPYSR
ncbi:hypothetical protein [Anaerolinea sp.]|uniref:hypothetical protein n=1 Tax=Anaerolinea sp. TaxID=1872519 RepID=UPI002ACF08FB|nr:hypothetical protein [Anaerolinea sp.]